MAQLYKSLKYGVCFPRSGSALVYLDAGGAPFDVVVGGGLLHKLSRKAV